MKTDENGKSPTALVHRTTEQFRLGWLIRDWGMSFMLPKPPNMDIDGVQTGQVFDASLLHFSDLGRASVPSLHAHDVASEIQRNFDIKVTF
jgi:hypothetical protein